MESKNAYEKAIAMTYYAFTSLSTVGFGDMRPFNDAERALVAFILLFGVAIFSYVMGNFISILDTFKSINAEMEDGDNLSRFFGLMKQFNKGRNIDNQMKLKIEDYMDYRWSNDRNLAISTDEDKALISQLPLEIQRKIYSDFLFKEFLHSFKRYFSFPNKESIHKNAFYTWHNFDYQNFMIDVLSRLEPISFPAKHYIYNELDDVNEVIFIESGMYDIGYEINKKTIHKLRFPHKTVIGAFEVCFDKRVLFIYKTFQECKGYLIRKKQFRELEKEHPELYDGMKKKAMFTYIQKIRRPLLEFKEEDIEFYDRRADYKQVLALRNYDENEIKDLVDSEIAKGNHKTSEEMVCMNEIERTVNTYERYLTKIFRNFDQAHDVYDYSVEKNKELLEENARLRKLAKEQGIDVEQLLKDKQHEMEELAPAYFRRVKDAEDIDEDS